MNILRRAIIALLGTIALVFGIMPAAQAYHVGPTVHNLLSSNIRVLCHTDSGAAYTTILSPNEYSPRGCKYIGVPDGWRFKYRSASGALYWTDCGDKLPNYDISLSNGGWQVVGNSVEVFEAIGYPNGVAAGCDPTP